MSKRSIYIAKIKIQLDELNDKMNKLDAKEDGRDMYREDVRELRHESQLASAKLDELGVATEATWDTFDICSFNVVRR